jgi:membrane-bound toxin of toxin-antitoxin system
VSGALRLELKPSRRLAAVIIVAHGAAAIAAYIAVPGSMTALLAALLLLLGIATAWGRALLAARASIRVIEVGAEPAAIELASGERFAVEVAQRRYVTRYLVALPLRGPSRRTLLVTADMLDPEEFRRLRIWALWNRLPRAHLANAGVAAKQLAA